MRLSSIVTDDKALSSEVAWLHSQAKRLLAAKKAAAQKKQGSSAAAAAAREAKERAKKAKGKKDKSHFNQVTTAPQLTPPCLTQTWMPCLSGESRQGRVQVSAMVKLRRMLHGGPQTMCEC